MHRRASHRARERRTRWSAGALLAITAAALTGIVPASALGIAAPAGATETTPPPEGLPVVLVHGLNSSAQVWQKYTADDGFLASIGRRGFAVGDGQAPGVMDMGSWLTAAARTNTIAENAAVLGEYIDGVRALTGAEHVDIVAHSMGGLVARYYIDHLMAERDVARLVMLGTPNGGSACASLPAALGIGTPATLELRPSYVSQVFNRVVTERNGVAFYVLAGVEVTDPIRSPCAAVPSDGVVSRASATTVDAIAAQMPLDHTGLPGSARAFDEFVRPVLTSDFDPNIFAVTPRAATGDSAEQFAAVASAHVSRGGSTEFVVQLDQVTVAAFALFDPSQSVEIEVRGASGGIIELDPSRNGLTIVDDPAALVHLGYGFTNPRPGPWRVTARATDATPAEGADIALAVRTTGGAHLQASTSTLIGQIGAPVEIVAELTAGEQPVDVTLAVALIRRPDGTAAEIPLAIDGTTARGTWWPDMSGVHGVDVRVSGTTKATSATDAAGPTGTTNATGSTGAEGAQIPVERVALLAVEIEPAPTQVWVARAVALSVLTLLIAVAALLAWRRRRRRRARWRDQVWRGVQAAPATPATGATPATSATPAAPA